MSQKDVRLLRCNLFVGEEKLDSKSERMKGEESDGMLT